MSDELVRAARYLNKAAELRAIADDDKHRVTREALLEVARTYERLAETMSLIHQGNEHGQLRNTMRGKFNPGPRSH